MQSADNPTPMNLPFELIHLGGEITVTGSSHLMMLPDGVTIMVDCGSAMGDDRTVPLAEMPVKASSIDYLLITHAHIDHIGRIPELIEAGFCGEILCTHGTKALLGPMLDDGFSFSDRPEKDRQRLMKSIDDLSWGFEYNETFTLKKGNTFTFGHAGHILGSCFIRFAFPVLTAIRSRPFFQAILEMSTHRCCLIRRRLTPAIFWFWNPPTAIAFIRIGPDAPKNSALS